MKSFKEILSEFSEMGSKHAFELHSGQECHGWIVAVESDHILFVDSDAQAGENETKLRFGAIHIDSLAYLDDDRKYWVAARWDDAGNRWVYTDLHADHTPEEAAPSQGDQGQQKEVVGKLTSFWKPKFRPRPRQVTSPAAPPLASQTAVPPL